jgi:hypothetical protein
MHWGYRTYKEKCYGRLIKLTKKNNRKEPKINLSTFKFHITVISVNNFLTKLSFYLDKADKFLANAVSYEQ